MKMMTRFVAALCPVLLLAFAGCRSVSVNHEADAYFKSWPKGQSPLEVGTKVAQHFVESPHFNSFRPGPPAYIIYRKFARGMARLRSRRSRTSPGSEAR